jgi:hypothetical protein
VHRLGSSVDRSELRGGAAISPAVIVELPRRRRPGGRKATGATVAKIASNELQFQLVINSAILPEAGPRQGLLRAGRGDPAGGKDEAGDIEQVDALIKRNADQRVSLARCPINGAP